MEEIKEIYYSAPTYDLDTKQWSDTNFYSKKEIRDHLDNKYKYPGEYNLVDTQGVWNEQGEYFNKNGFYSKFVNGSQDFINHWDFEKRKCEFDGFIIYKSEKKNVEFTVAGLYYWYINYCPIFDKLKGRPSLPTIYDMDYHYYLYKLRCIYYGKYGVVLKKRQSGFTLKNMATMLNCLWFGEAWITKIFAYDEAKIKDSWQTMEAYRDHINKYCGWKRYFEPSKVLDWQQKVKTRDGQSSRGNMSIAKGKATRGSASSIVGGNIKFLFGEESGINSTLDITHEYVTSNVSLGGATTGLIMYSGAVGELDKCEPLKKFMLNPTKYDFMPSENPIEEDIEEFGVNPVGFFVPEWWNYVYEDEDGELIYCYDKWGNSNKEKSIKYIVDVEYKKAEEKDVSDFIQFKSQRPLSIKAALAYRKQSVFPQALLARQLHRIQRGDYPYKTYDLERTEDGIKFKKNLYPENIDYPFKPKKGLIPYGCIQVWEDPYLDSSGKVPHGLYYAAVDPIQVDITTTSDSLFCTYIFKNATEVTYQENGEEKIKMEGDRIVAKYLGRKQDRKTTNETGLMLIEKYNAFAVVENNFDNFIQYVIRHQKQKHLALKEDLPFLKELTNKGFASTKEYGVRTNKAMWDQQYIPKPIEYMKEEMGVEHKSTGEELRKIYGVEKIPDVQLIKEYLAFTDEKGNYDAIVTFGLVLAMAKARQASHQISKITRGETKKEDLSKYKYQRKAIKTSRYRKAFRNIR